MTPLPASKLCALCALMAPIALADVANLGARKDNTIYSESGALSNGMGRRIFTGKTLGRRSSDLRRALLDFDIAAGIPAGATINSATITLTVTKTRSGSPICNFHRLTSDWGEGASNASGPEGRGTTAQPGDATWTRSFSPATTWTTDGGEFNLTDSASTAVGGQGSLNNWTSAQLAADVQDMLDNPGSNFGWILIGAESTPGSAKRFASLQSPTVANRPLLVVDFTPPVTPFTVDTTTPTQAQLEVSASTDVTATFSDPVNNTTITTSSFKVWGRQSGFKAGTFTAATFDPTVDFNPGEQVHLMLNGSIESGTGTALTPHISQFRVAAGGGDQFLLGAVQTLGTGASFDIGIGDLNGDGYLDAFVTNNGAGNTVWINDGTGSFTDTGQSLGTAKSLTVELGDLNGDGDLDAFIGNDDGPNAVWLGDGRGQFVSNGQTTLGNDRSFGVGLGDLDGDGDLDAFVSNNGTADKVWTNDGSGTFSDSGQTLGNAGSRHLALGDLDGDGDLDAYVAVRGGGDRVWINDGTGTFTAGQSLGTAASFGVSLGDLNGDGDLDAFVSTVNNAGNLVWTNDGTGSFTDSGQLLGTDPSRSVELGDVDGDGDLDAFVVNNAPAANQVWTNNGSGTFTDSGVSFGSSAHRDIALGDLDDDGDLDVVLANTGAPNEVFLNFHNGETSDFDSDGLPNDYEVENNLNPADAADAGADPDGDGNTTLDEFIADTDPNDFNSAFSITDAVLAGTAAISVTSSNARLYTLQRSSTLEAGSFQDVPGQIDVPGNGTILILTDPNPVGDKLFYRVVVSIP